jgi:hypothetical protein
LKEIGVCLEELHWVGEWQYWRRILWKYWTSEDIEGPLLLSHRGCLFLLSCLNFNKISNFYCKIRKKIDCFCLLFLSFLTKLTKFGQSPKKIQVKNLNCLFVYYCIYFDLFFYFPRRSDGNLSIVFICDFTIFSYEND